MTSTFPPEAMVLMQRVVKPKTQRAKRALQAREPKAVENTKNTLFIKGSTCSARVSQVLKDLYALKRPYGELYLKRPGADENRGQKGANKGFDIRPFEDATQLERFGKKKDASLFAFGSHNKKRPGKRRSPCSKCCQLSNCPPFQTISSWVACTTNICWT